MLSHLKKISAGLITAILMVTFLSAGVSASSVGVQSKYNGPEGVTLTYRSMVKKKWQSAKNQGELSGTTGKSLKLEAIQINIKSETAGGIEYSVGEVKKSFAAAKTSGQTAGGKGKSLARIRMNLTGELAEKYDIYYRTHISMKNGWLGWAKNGEISGNADYWKTIDAIQIVLTAKDAEAPGNIGGVTSARNTAYYTAQDIKDAMTAKAQGLSSKTNYLVLASRSKYFTAVFKGSKGNWQLVRFIYCSVGKKSTKTRTGTYKIKNKKKYFLSGNVRVKYASRYVGGYYFHSVCYNLAGKKIVDGRLGKQISHGCIRMSTADAKYIYKTVPKNSKVVVY